MPQQKRQASNTHPEQTAKDPPTRRIPAARTKSLASPLIPDYILRFLNALPITGDVIEWTRSFREALQGLLGDVDRVIVNIDAQCDLALDPRRRTGFDVALLADVPRRRSRGKGDLWLEKKTPSQHLLDDLQRLGYPLSDYHAPRIYDYYFTGNVYLGTVLLLRDRIKAPIAERTLEAMQGLEPFMVFALSDLVARYAYARPINRAFQNALNELALETKLTRRELQVLTLHLFGRRYDEIARQLYISIDTVKKHVKKIHRKTGARSSTDLFARYFTPLIDLENLDVDIDL